MVHQLIKRTATSWAVQSRWNAHLFKSPPVLNFENTLRNAVLDFHQLLQRFFPGRRRIIVRKIDKDTRHLSEGANLIDLHVPNSAEGHRTSRGFAFVDVDQCAGRWLLRFEEATCGRRATGGAKTKVP